MKSRWTMLSPSWITINFSASLTKRIRFFELLKWRELSNLWFIHFLAAPYPKRSWLIKRLKILQRLRALMKFLMKILTPSIYMRKPNKNSKNTQISWIYHQSIRENKNRLKNKILEKEQKQMAFIASQEILKISCLPQYKEKKNNLVIWNDLLFITLLNWIKSLGIF